MKPDKATDTRRTSTSGSVSFDNSSIPSTGTGKYLHLYFKGKKTLLAQEQFGREGLCELQAAVYRSKPKADEYDYRCSRQSTAPYLNYAAVVHDPAIGYTKFYEFLLLAGCRSELALRGKEGVTVVSDCTKINEATVEVEARYLQFYKQRKKALLTQITFDSVGLCDFHAEYWTYVFVQAGIQTEDVLVMCHNRSLTERLDYSAVGKMDTERVIRDDASLEGCLYNAKHMLSSVTRSCKAN